MVRHSKPATLAAALSLCGCAAAPVPELEVAPTVLSQEWRGGGRGGGRAGAGRAAGPAPAAEPLAGAWPAFHSAELDRLIARARAANTDLAIARARIIQARGQLGVARSATLPSLGLPSARAGPRPGGRGKPVFSHSAGAGLDIAWDLDL